MASSPTSEDFPTELINVEDLLIERAPTAARGDFGDLPTSLTTISSGLQAIVERKSDLIRNPATNEEIAQVAEVRISGVALDVQEKDLVSFTDGHGFSSQLEVVIIELFHHPGLTHTLLRLGRRT